MTFIWTAQHTRDVSKKKSNSDSNEFHETELSGAYQASPLTFSLTPSQTRSAVET